MTSRTAPATPSPTLASAAFLRLGGWSAIGFATIILLTNVYIQASALLPITGADVSELDAARASAVRLTSAVLPAAWVLATIFGASVVAEVHRRDAKGFEGWSLVGFAGLLAQNATFAAVTGIRLGLIVWEVQGDGAAGLWAFHDALFGLNGTFLALALVGLSLSGVRTGLIPAWLSRLGLVSAALLFASASLTALVMAHGGPLGLVGVTGWLLWVLWLVVYGVRPVRHRVGENGTDSRRTR